MGIMLAGPTTAFAARRPKSALLILLCLVLTPLLNAQPKGVVEGRLINRTDPSIAARAVTVEAVSLGAGMSVLKTTKTDSSGGFRLEGLPENQRLLIRADYKTVLYHAMAGFDADGKARVEIEVYEPTASMKDIRIEGGRIAFQMTGDRLKSLESVSVKNETKPPRTYVNPEGTFRFSKAPGILETPVITVAAPGSSMPVVQAALESPDGRSYYSLYPLRPGTTTFEVEQLLPYSGRSYVYVKKFYADVGPLEIGVIPRDMALSGRGLSRIHDDPQGNFAVYRSEPLRAGSEVVWTFSGGTPVGARDASEAGGAAVRAVPGPVIRNAFIIGPLLLMGLILILWYGFHRDPGGSADSRMQQLKRRREQLLDDIADLDRRHEAQALDRQEYLRRREAAKRRLRRVILLMRKS